MIYTQPAANEHLDFVIEGTSTENHEIGAVCRVLPVALLDFSVE